MKTKYIQEIIIKEKQLVILYRSRYYSKRLNKLIDIPGNKALHVSKESAIKYACSFV